MRAFSSKQWSDLVFYFNSWTILIYFFLRRVGFCCCFIYFSLKAGSVYLFILIFVFWICSYCFVLVDRNGFYIFLIFFFFGWGDFLVDVCVWWVLGRGLFSCFDLVLGEITVLLFWGFLRASLDGEKLIGEESLLDGEMRRNLRGGESPCGDSPLLI